MSTLCKYLVVSLCAYSSHLLYADSLSFDSIPDMIDFSQEELIKTPLQEVVSTPVITEEKVAPKMVQKAKEVPFTPFTGKIKGRKVRLRVEADLDSHIVKELVKNELVSIVGEKEDFWAVQPPQETKAYIFRSFVLDNVVEGNRVNVRLEPSLDAPVIAHMHSGQRLEHAVISPINNKWLEIQPPEQTVFYMAKEYVEYAGGPELKAQMDRRMATAHQLLDANYVLQQAELRKSFEEMDFDRIINNYTTVIKDYSEFPELVENAREALTAFQEKYLEKRIQYLESRPAVTQIKEEDAHKAMIQELSETLTQVTDKMRVWEPLEEALYSAWTNINETKTLQEFYEDQKLTSVLLTGIVEPYNSPVKSKPGDFIIRENEVPVGYVYSTQINLQSLVGKHVTLIASPRPNNNFAFPAYYILSVE